MATITPTITDVSDRGDGSAIAVSWSAVTEADTCTAVKLPKNADKSVVVTGTFGSASVAIQGANDAVGANFAALNDVTETVIAITTAGSKAIAENTTFIKPVPSGGSSQSLKIDILAVFPNPQRQ